MERCDWCLGFDQYIEYHDQEWGVPVNEDIVHFEFLTLEGAQAGLSWSTILKRREGYRRAFQDFNPEAIANFTREQIEEILLDTGIIRNRLKVESVVTNAQAFLRVQEEFGDFNTYIWSFVGGAPIVNNWEAMDHVPPTTPESDLLSKDLKKRGFKFVGSTIMYAYMQACGLVNDHVVDCFRYKQIIDGY